MQIEWQQLQNTTIITAEDKIHSKTVLTKHLENLTLSPQTSRLLHKHSASLQKVHFFHSHYTYVVCYIEPTPDHSQINKINVNNVLIISHYFLNETLM